ncbi:MAG: hypothetical protein Q9198_006187 [Flavoplaca austrocitrina]
MQPGKTPALTIWSENARPLIVGEVKTPWTCDLEERMEQEPNRGTIFRNRFPRSAGQVAEYMKRYRLKYGFLTTYTETVFFKQEVTPFDGGVARINDIREIRSDA